MEVRPASIYTGLRILLCSMLLVLAVPVCAQPNIKSYSVKDGNMVITLSKHLSPSALDSFVLNYDLSDLDLPRLMNTGKTDSLEKLGWSVDIGKRDVYLLRKPLIPAGSLNNPADVILFTHDSSASQLPVNQVHFGFNRFKGKSPFVVKDSVVSFLLRGYPKANRVELAGSFTNWQHGAFRMQQSADGWVIAVKLLPGKHLYKFIVDGNWIIDRENALVENDGLGNDNSVYFKTNYVFRIAGYTEAKKVFLAGSFNHWQERALPMQRTVNGWEVPVYLSEGTHTYRFIADGKWFVDPANPDRLPNEFNDFNSVLRLGKPYVFKLDGFKDAKKVTLFGSFNDWKEDELFLKQTASGWENAVHAGSWKL